MVKLVFFDLDQHAVYNAFDTRGAVERILSAGIENIRIFFAGGGGA